ncbi:Retrovirus-related Pol polyprotein from transposon 17.6 [Thelohanellus kitauei]|uniref:RNA-directed DNA polymerase n=1 Tax=Thelohanellus kitauei TaxID=669202 RepID=A0A0C2MD24_THEKT|nr:Retrovirus-related Pol polyprotein from transposon 17.6 [Thelohanellus kitauei]
MDVRVTSREIVAAVEREVHKVQAFLSEFIYVFGVPKTLHTDQKANFKTRTAPYHPQSDGLVERFNKTLVNMIWKSIYDDSQWDEHIKKLTFSYNIRAQDTMSSPYSLMFGRDPRSVLDGKFNLKQCKSLSVACVYVLPGAEKPTPEFLGDLADLESWIFRFNLIAKGYKWGDEERSDMLPTYFVGNILECYRSSGLESIPSSKKKFDETVQWLRNQSIGADSLSSNYQKFESLPLLPGQDPVEFVNTLSSLLKNSRPKLSVEDHDFLVIQKFLKSIPESVSSILRLFNTLSPKDLADKGRILLSSAMQPVSHKVMSVVSNGELEECAGQHRIMPKSLEEKLDDIARRLDALEVNGKKVQTSGPNVDERCQKCGRNGHLTEKCRAYIRCYNCGEEGHTQRFCRRTSRNNNSFNSYSSKRYFCGSFRQNNDIQATIPMILENGTVLNVLIDTGASVSLIHSKFVSSKPLSRSYYRLVSAFQTQTTPIGSVALDITLARKSLSWSFLVVDALLFDAIIGRDLISKFKAVVNISSDSVLEFPKSIAVYNNFTFHINKDLDSQTNGQVTALLCQNNQIFAKSKFDTGVAKDIEFPINIVKDEPIKKRPYRIPINVIDEVKTQIDQMLQMSIIRPSNSPWSAPSLLVKKKDGSHRMCVDFRSLNAITIKDEYSLPLIDSILDQLSGCRFFSTLDMQNGYWQIPIKEADKQKTGFCPGPGMGHYEFNVLPFGLANAPATFQRFIDKVLEGLPNCSGYLDDIIIYSKTPQEHILHLGKVFERLKEFGLKLKQSKCFFAQSKIKFLGFIVSGSGICPDPSHIEALLNWKCPQNADELRRYLGTCNFYSRFLKNFAHVATPLYNLLKKSEIWIWDTSCQNSFNSLIDMLKNIKSVWLPDPILPFRLSTDASDVAVGAVLSQLVDGIDTPISFASQKLSPAQIKYSTFDKECYAILWAIRKFRHFLYGKHFEVFTDHNPLVHLHTMKYPRGRRSRWLLELQ